MCLGIPGRIVEMSNDAGLPMGVVDFGGVRREVCLAYVADEIAVGDYAIVHVGFAISKVDEEEANRTYEVLREMGELEELEWIREAADAAASVQVPGAPSGPPAGDAGPGASTGGGAA
jgi:hydrogenase expression/formation protein HypC